MEQRTYRVGIVGCGGIAIGRSERTASALRWPLPHSHASAYHAVPRTEVVAVCDVVPEATARYVETWGPVATYTDYRAMLDREKLDLLSIVTPDDRHTDIFVDACAAGVKGIFCEKPLATTLADVDRMIGAAERHRTKALVDHLRRFDAFYRQAKLLIAEGVIGSVVRVVGTMGGERAMLFRNGTHLIDTLCYLIDSEPAWLIAELDDAEAGYGTDYRGNGGRDAATEPGASGYIHFRNGVRAFYNGSKAAFSKGLKGATGSYFEIDLQGESGRICIGDQIAELWTVGAGHGLARQPLPQTIEMKAPMVTAIEDLIDLIERDGDGTAGLRDGRLTLEILLGLLASASRGSEKVTFPFVPRPVAVAG